MSRRSSSSKASKSGFAFRPAAAKRTPAPSKVVSFDEIEAQTTTVTRTRRTAQKAKPTPQPSTPELPPSPDAIEHNKSRKRPASAKKTSPKKASPRKAATKKTPAKQTKSEKQEQSKRQKTSSRYPSIEMDANQYRNSAGKSHKAALVRIVKDVCAVELEGLKRHFAEQDDKSEVLKSLQSVLEELPKLVNEDIEEPVTYKPERQLHDAKAMLDCDETLRHLANQQERLQQLVDNLDDCGEQFDLMLHPPEDEESVEPSAKTQEAVDNFKARLDTMVRSVQSIKDEASSISEVMSLAYEVQSTLYDTYKATARFEGVHRSTTQDTIRQLVQLSSGVDMHVTNNEI